MLAVQNPLFADGDTTLAFARGASRNYEEFDANRMVGYSTPAVCAGLCHSHSRQALAIRTCRDVDVTVN